MHTYVAWTFSYHKCLIFLPFGLLDFLFQSFGGSVTGHNGQDLTHGGERRSSKKIEFEDH